MTLAAVGAIPFRGSKGNVCTHLLLNVPIISIWEIKLEHQSNDFSADMTLRDKCDGQFAALAGSPGLCEGLAVPMSLHAHKHREGSTASNATALGSSALPWTFT